ncbi:MAG TPA: TolC family protein [Terriglobia bacterium]|nr:TolC family protein [Terriglobia bacterium]
MKNSVCLFVSRLASTRAILTALLALAFVSPAAAQKSRVEEFLERYKFMNKYRPAPITLPEPMVSQTSLENYIRGGALQLGVGDVIELTLRNNLDIVVDRLGPYSTQLLVDTAYRPFEPTARFGASISHDKSPSRSQLTGTEPVSQTQLSLTAGLTQNLPTGTQFAVDASLIRASSNNIFNTFNPAWTGLIRYSATQHLLRDYGRSANMYQIRVARNNEEISEVQFERQVIELVTQAEKSYWDLVFTAEDLKVKRESLALANKTLTDNQRQVAIGTLAPIDVVQAEKEVASRNLDVVKAVGTQQLTEDQIKKLISNRPDPGMTLAGVTPLDNANAPEPADILGPELAIKLALENRPEMRQIDYELRNRDLALDYQRNQLLPQIDAFVTFNQNGVGGKETLRNGFGPGAPVIAVNEGGVLNSLGQLFSFGYPGFSVGVNVQIPLRNRSQQAEYARAYTERRTTESRLDSTAQQISLEVRNSITAVETSKAGIEAARKTRELAERTLEAEQKKFDLGASTIRFVLEEQRNLLQAKTNEIAALVNYAKALVDYERATGQTLKKRNIDIDKTLNLPGSGRGATGGAPAKK